MVFVVRYHDMKQPQDSVDKICDSGGSRHLLENKAKECAEEHAEKFENGDVFPFIKKGTGITWQVYDGERCLGFYYMESIKA